MTTDHSKNVLGGKFGPTVIQVAAGVYAGVIWAMHNPNAGCKWPEDLNLDPIINSAKPLIGDFVSTRVDLSKTLLKNCEKL